MIAPAIGAVSSFVARRSAGRRLRGSRTGSRIIREGEFRGRHRGCEAATRGGRSATYPVAPTAIFSQFRANASLIMCRRGEYPQQADQTSLRGDAFADRHPDRRRPSAFYRGLGAGGPGHVPRRLSLEGDLHRRRPRHPRQARPVRPRSARPVDARHARSRRRHRAAHPLSQAAHRRRLRARRPAHHPRGDAMRRRRLHLQVVARRRSRSRAGGRHVRLGGAAEGLSAAGAVRLGRLRPRRRASPR